MSVQRLFLFFIFRKEKKKVIKANIRSQGARYLDCPRQKAPKSASPSEARYWHEIVVDGVFWISIIQSQSSTLSSIFSTRTSPCSVFDYLNKITLLAQVCDKVVEDGNYRYVIIWFSLIYPYYYSNCYILFISFHISL